MDPLGKFPVQDYRKEHHNIHIEPEVKVALIEVAGRWAMELNKANPDVAPNDLLKSFRDAYNSLVITFLVPEDRDY